MINAKKITLEAKPIFDYYFQKSDNSALNFTTLYIWEQDFNTHYIEQNGCFALLFYVPNGHIYATVPYGNGDFEKTASDLANYMVKKQNRADFVFLTTKDISALSKIFPERFSYVAYRNDADYIYSTESLSTLSGKKLHGKKNHLNAFFKQYSYRYEKMTHAQLPVYMSFTRRWAENLLHHTAARSVEATEKLLRNADALGVTCGGIWVDNNLVAFSAGQPQNKNIALIHLEYADYHYRGAYQAINWEFVRRNWMDYPFINREEDMGVPTLRKAKESYYPVRMIQKFYAKERSL